MGETVTKLKILRLFVRLVFKFYDDLLDSSDNTLGCSPGGGVRDNVLGIPEEKGAAVRECW